VFRRAITTLTLASTILASTWVVLGLPDFGRSTAFFDSGIPTLESGEALMVLLAWMVVLVAVIAVLVGTMRSIARTPHTHATSGLAGVVLAVALVLLVVSAVHRLLPPASICCGSGPAEIREAIQLAR
jgi:hypothetical protein